MNFAAGAVLLQDDMWRDHASAALGFVWERHRDQDHGGYSWKLTGSTVTDPRKMAYGHAFVLLAAAAGIRADLAGAPRLLADVLDVLDAHFDDHGPGQYLPRAEREHAPVRGTDRDLGGHP